MDKVERAREAFKLWFFRDLTDSQRVGLIRLVLGKEIANEATNQGRQVHCVRAILAALREPSNV